ncbi:hypothetical protein Tco_1478523 [Tanacetum coccineum]
MYNLGVITFLASRLQSASLETKLLRHSGIVAYGPAFDDSLWLCGNLKWRITLLIGLGWFRFLGWDRLCGISAGKEVDIGLGRGCDKPLCPADMLLYSWDVRLDMCVDLTGSLPLTQTGMVDFVPGYAVIDAAHRKRVKYEAKCADIGYGFLPFSFSSLGELEKDAVTLLKRI